MGTWTSLLKEFNDELPSKRGEWLDRRLTESLHEISHLCDNRNVLFYGSAFLQKVAAPGAFLQINAEDVNGFMAAMCGMDWSKGLVLVLHTPGGSINAAETLVEYLHQKFNYIEAVVPVYAMSAGTMISLAADKIWMGRQSQLGPIDPHFQMRDRMISAGAVVSQFEEAKKDILSGLDPARTAALWAPVLQHLGPSLLMDAKNALHYGEKMVARWLERRQFKSAPDAAEKAERVAKYFNSTENHKSHGRRIGRDEARNQGLTVGEFDHQQEFQDAILTSYHLATLLFEQTSTCRFVASNEGQRWMKNVQLVGG